MSYRIAADAVLLLHVLFVVFVIAGQVLIIGGKALGWNWVRNLRFRIAHMVAIVIVVLQSWLGVICPLTAFEMALRARSGDVTYSGSFIVHWLDSILYYQAPPWAFVACYTAFGALVALSWIWIPPRTRKCQK